ncbi:MAG: hypothetical protein ACI3Y4_05020 [Candidatus Cryptobacteroides sp.]
MSTKRLKYILVLASLLLPMLCSGQVSVFTKKQRIADFAAKTTKIVLTDNEAFDLCLKSEIASRWRISPYEFCSRAEYENNKSSSKYYFLHSEKKESGLTEMTLTRGGGKGGSSNLDSRLDVVSVPVDIRYMSIIIDIIQNYVEDAKVSETKGLLGLKSYNGNLRKVTRKKLYYANREDEYFTDSLISNSAPCLVAFSITPDKPSQKAKAALFIASADTHELYYYKKRKFSVEADRNFSEKEQKELEREHGYSL